MKVGILKNYFGNGISKIGILKNYFENEIFIRGNLGEWHMAWGKVAMHSQTLQRVLYFYNIKFKSSLWIPSQNSFLYVFKLIPIFIVLSPVRSKPIFMLKKYHTHTNMPFSNAYIYHTHIINPFFYAYSMSESYTWDVVCERQRDPSYVSRERRVVTGM